MTKQDLGANLENVSKNVRRKGKTEPKQNAATEKTEDTGKKPSRNKRI